RFAQVSGISYGFDPAKPSGSRIQIASVRIQGRLIEPSGEYLVATKKYMAIGKEGYNVMAKFTYLCGSFLKLTDQPLLCLQRLNSFLLGRRSQQRHSLIQTLERHMLSMTNQQDSVDEDSCVWRRGRSHTIDYGEPSKLNSISPKIEGRIVCLGENE
ncbi:unnamed protein product, partial [Protopolystoma xenopodis]